MVITYSPEVDWPAGKVTSEICEDRHRAAEVCIWVHGLAIRTGRPTATARPCGDVTDELDEMAVGYVTPKHGALR
jgi:hypothetical protein